MYSRMVVPLDGSDFGEHAITAAAVIARRAAAEIELVHVHQPRYAEPYLGDITAYQFQDESLWQARYDRARLDEERAALKARADRLGSEDGIPATARILEGGVPSALRREVEQLEADLVVMATHARHGVSRWRHGSMGDAFVRGSNVPTLLVRPSDPVAIQPREFRRILVALDGSAFSEEILEPALRLAELLDAEVTLLHVVTPPGRAASPTDQRADGPIAHLRTDSDAYLRSASERFANTRTTVSIRTAIADRAAPCIAEVAAARRCDMIALATHGRGGVSRLLLGSTADQLLGMTWTPVLALRPKQLRAASLELDDFSGVRHPGLVV
jgi:nucleotide-binding universal stress UspA family protein